jgi:hypothetical protein
MSDNDRQQPALLACHQTPQCAKAAALHAVSASPEKSRIARISYANPILRDDDYSAKSKTPVTCMQLTEGL